MARGGRSGLQRFYTRKSPTIVGVRCAVGPRNRYSSSSGTPAPLSRLRRFARGSRRWPFATASSSISVLPNCEAAWGCPSCCHPTCKHGARAPSLLDTSAVRKNGRRVGYGVVERGPVPSPLTTALRAMADNVRMVSGVSASWRFFLCLFSYSSRLCRLLDQSGVCVDWVILDNSVCVYK